MRGSGHTTSDGLRLSPAERRAWREDGFFVRHGVLDTAEVDALRDAAERAVEIAHAGALAGGASYSIDGNRYHEARGSTIQYEHREGSQTIRVIEPFHHLDARFDQLVDDARFVEPARDLVGCERIALFTSKLNLKRPREGSRFRWHQDSPYWAHFFPDVDRLPNVMLALDDASPANGCLHLVPGSHAEGMLPGLEGQGRLGPLFTDPAYFDASRAVPAEMGAGSLLFFHPSVVHGSEPNASDELRRALLYTYQPGGNRLFKVDAKREAGV